jgi:hypothetical protein
MLLREDFWLANDLDNMILGAGNMDSEWLRGGIFEW